MVLATIDISKEARELAYRYAAAKLLQNDDNYEQRNQHDPIRKFYQNIDSKISEWAVREWLITEKGENGSLTQVDYDVHPLGKRSYSPDLFSKANCYHIKSQTYQMECRFGASWLFSVGDPIMTDPRENDLIILTTILEKTVWIKGTIKASKCVGKYGEPQKNFDGTKKALYWKDLTNKETT